MPNVQKEQVSAVETTNLLLVSSTTLTLNSTKVSPTDTPSHQNEPTQKGTTTSNKTITTLTTSTLNRCRRLLYVSHFVNQFSEKTWWFCSVLFLTAFANYESLLLVTSYGLCSYSFVFAFGASAGRFVDDVNRLRVAQLFIGLENCCVLFATGLCYILLAMAPSSRTKTTLFEELDPTTMERTASAIPTDPTSIVLLIGIHMLGATAAVLDRGFSVAVERDWIVVMSSVFDGRPTTTTTSTTNHEDAGVSNDRNNVQNVDDFGAIEQKEENQKRQQHHQRKWLTETNVAMTQIDLGCQVISPAVAGAVVAMFDSNTEDGGHKLAGAVLLVGSMTVAALVVEYFCTAHIYHSIPDLAIKETTTATETLLQIEEEQEQDNILLLSPIPDTPTALSALPSQEDQKIDLCQEDRRQNRSIGDIQNIRRRFPSFKLPNSILVYFDQPICWAGVSLSLLHLNVILTFGGIMTAYLVWRDMSLTSIGIWRGVSSAVGLAGTFAYNVLDGKMHRSRIEIGMLGVVFQFMCLTACIVSFFIDDDDYRIASLSLLIGGVCLSRIGLWVFDIAVTQLMQEHIPAPIRGLVGGVQSSMDAFFCIVTFSAGLFISDPQDFHVYALIGYVGVGLAVTCFSVRVHAIRHHIEPGGP